MSNKKKQQQISLTEELILVGSLRYSIGRRSYISGLSSDIAPLYYDRLGDRMESFSNLIIETINDCFRLTSGGVYYDSSVPYDERNAIEDIIDILGKIKDKEELIGIDRIEIFKKDYKKETPKDFEIIRNERNKIYQKEYDTLDSEISNLLNWYTLAKLFDKKSYKTIKYLNPVTKTEEENIFVETYEQCREIIKEDNNMIYPKELPLKYKKCYIPIDYAKNGQYNVKLNENYIIKIN